MGCCSQSGAPAAPRPPPHGDLAPQLAAHPLRQRRPAAGTAGCPQAAGTLRGAAAGGESSQPRPPRPAPAKHQQLRGRPRRLVPKAAPVPPAPASAPPLHLHCLPPPPLPPPPSGPGSEPGGPTEPPPPHCAAAEGPPPASSPDSGWELTVCPPAPAAAALCSAAEGGGPCGCCCCRARAAAELCSCAASPGSPTATSPRPAAAAAATADRARLLPHAPPHLCDVCAETFLRHRMELAAAEEAAGEWAVGPLLALPLPPQIAVALRRESRECAAELAALTARRAALPEGHPSGAAYDIALRDGVADAISACSDTCSGAGRATGRGRRARRNVRLALAAARRLAGKASGDLGTSDDGHCCAFFAVNRVVYDRLMETLPPSHLGVSRQELQLPAQLSGVTRKGHKGAADLPPPHRVDAALAEVSVAAAQWRRSGDPEQGAEAAARQLLGDLTVHPCANGNGRTALCLAVATLESYGLPPMALPPACARLARVLGGQVAPAGNVSPADAAFAVALGMRAALHMLQRTLPVTPAPDPDLCSAYGAV
eukprot:TRINITY_DN13766_c0_g2_i2.p1 TRINITY_DN13766_c0_g2~~TRINITY_DN13766_c0_g2_i2.p1  ORF type:complete len:542 (+),score=99.01 TRINITY_DN13766_c0_g2_i2:86-1711(+)